jgi:hypothetical protein
MASRFLLAFEQYLRNSKELCHAFHDTQHISAIDGILVNFNFDNAALLTDIRAMYNHFFKIVSEFIEIPMRDYEQDVKDWNLRRRAEGHIEFRSCMWAAKACIAADLTIYRAIADGETPPGRTLRPRMEANSRFHNLGRSLTSAQLSRYAYPSSGVAAPTRSATNVSDVASAASEDSDAMTTQAASFETGSSGSFDENNIRGLLPPRNSSLAPKLEVRITKASASPCSPPHTPSLRREPRRIETHFEEERKFREMAKQLTPKKSFWKNPLKGSKETASEGKKLSQKKSVFFFRKMQDNDTDV